MRKPTNGNDNGGTALVSLDITKYPALVGGPEAVANLKTNLAGESFGPADLTRIRVPSGGSTSWTVVDADGEEDAVKAVEGIVVHIARRRAYWESVEPTGDPPQCTSADCITGIGNPGGSCDHCPLNQFGSATKADGGQGRGKACKETKLLFLLREGCVLPDVVVCPAGSLKAIKQYQLKLANTAPYWGVVTRLELSKVQNKDGIAYAQIVPKKVSILDADTAKGIVGYAQALQALFSSVSIDQADVSVPDNGAETV